MLNTTLEVLFDYAFDFTNLNESDAPRIQPTNWTSCRYMPPSCHHLLANVSAAKWTTFNHSHEWLHCLRQCHEEVHCVGDDCSDDLRALYAVVVPVMLSACGLALLLNLLVLFGASRLRRTLSPTLLLSLSLAAADAHSSLAIAVGLVLNSLLPRVFGLDPGRCSALVLEAVRLAGMVVAALHLVALAVNHYIGIARPLHYVATVTRRKVWWTIFWMWLAPPLFFLTYFALVPHDGFRSPSCARHDFLLRLPFRLVVAGFFFAPLLLMGVLYLRVFRIARRCADLPGARRLRRSMRAVVTTLLILGTYVLAWVPAVAVFLLTCPECPVPAASLRPRVRVPIFTATNSLIVAKAFLDPLVYAARMPEVRAAMRAACGCRRDDRLEPTRSCRTLEMKVDGCSSVSRDGLQRNLY